MNKTGVFTSCDVPVCRCTFVQLNEETLGGSFPHGEVVKVSEKPGFLWLCSALASRLMACCHSAWRRCGEEHGWGDTGAGGAQVQGGTQVWGGVRVEGGVLCLPCCCKIQLLLMLRIFFFKFWFSVFDLFHF